MKCQGCWCDDTQHASVRKRLYGVPLCDMCWEEEMPEVPEAIEPSEEDDRNAAESDRIQMYMDEY